MKPRRISLAFSVLLLAVGLFAVPIVWIHFQTLYPTAETESSFLKNYTTRSVIERFEDKRAIRTTSAYKGGDAGRKFVTHTAQFYESFGLRTEECIPLMNALRDDMARQLVENGASILSENGDARQGFRFDYQIDKSLGSVTIMPLTSTPRMRQLPTGSLDAGTSILITEKWFPKKPSMIRFLLPATPSVRDRTSALPLGPSSTLLRRSSPLPSLAR